MKRIVRLTLTVVTITALLLPSCGPKPPPPPTPVEATPVPVEATPITPPEEITLEFWSMWNEPEPQGDVLKKYAEGFEAETGIKVNITFNGRDNQTLLRTALGAGTKIDLMDQDGAPLAGGLMSEGQGYALDDMLDEDAWGESGRPFRDIFLPGLLEQFQLDGKTYLIPHTLITYAIWYDKRDFAEAGIEAVPETWDEFLEACEKIKATGVEPIAQDAGVNFYNIIWYFYLVERLKGPGFLLAAAEDTTGALWDDPAFVKAAEMERQLWDNGYIVEGAEGFTWPQGQQTLADDISAMELCGSWLPNELKDAVDPEFEWGGLPFPSVEGGEGKGTDIPVVMLDFMVLKDAAHPKEAFDFIRYCLSKENVKMWADETISGVPRKDVDFPALLKDAKTMFKNATAFFDEVDGVTFKQAEYANNVLMPTHDEVFMGQITPEEFAAKMKELTITYWETREAPPEAEAPPEPLDSEATLEFWSMWNEPEPQGDVLKKYAEGFEAETGIKVNITFNGRDNQTLLRTALGAGTKIDLMDQDGAPLAGGLMSEGQGYALDDMLDEDAWGESGRPFRDIFRPGLLEQFQLDGKTYLIPHTLITYAIWHDKRILQEAGVEAAPETWEEFLAALDKIKDAGYEPIAQDAGVNFYNIIWFFYLVERLKGPGFLLAAAEDKTGALWDDPAFVKAAEMEQVLWNNYVVEGAEGFTWPQGQQTLADGISAMELCGSWLPNELKEAVDPEFEWGGWAFPMVEGGEGKGTDIPVVMLDFMVMKDTEHPREAFAFIRYCLSKENVQMWADDTISGVPRSDVGFPALIADAEDMFKNATAFFDEVDGVTFKQAEYANNVLMPTHDEVFMGQITPEEFAAKMKELTITYWETH
jgi:raffinose/stachyose/melibiose transport system substrate-binding protein